ncbi:MAG: FecR domain-containing protein [Smithella sp.]
MRKTLIMIGIVILCCTYNAMAEELKAGFIKNVSGQSYIERNKVIIHAAANEKLMEKDILITGKDGAMGVILQDNGVMSMGPNTRVEIAKFLFEPAADKLSFTARIKQGTVVYLTGLIAKLNRKGIKFETPTTVCGVRGTHFAIKVEGSGKESCVDQL